MSSLSSCFKRPLLIYDDKCYSCARFARIATVVSRGWIRTAGHHYSKEAKEAKEMIFPHGYDATKMFWLINKRGAHGARSGLIPLTREILIGIFRSGGNFRSGGKVSYINTSCEFGNDHNMSCYATASVLWRVIGTLNHGTTFRFDT
jgi:hypothetical protein